MLARFVPIVRTFAPVAAGVGHMNYRRYSIYNAIGAFIWGTGLTFVGFLLGYIPPLQRVRRRVHRRHPAARDPDSRSSRRSYHYIRSVLKARKARKLGVKPLTDEEIVLDPEVFEEK